MLKICDEAIVLPLKLIYTNCLEKGVYPNLWKKANVLLIHKKESHQLTGQSCYSTAAEHHSSETRLSSDMIDSSIMQTRMSA